MGTLNPFLGFQKQACKLQAKIYWFFNCMK